MQRRIFFHVATVLLAGIGALAPCRTYAEPFLVQDGTPRAQIITASEPPRLVTLAAQELQRYLAKISGAALPIKTEPDVAVPVTIYVGASPHTQRLGITADGLRYGAFRIVSGANYLVLLGDDFDFEPREPWPRSHGDRERAQREWEAMDGTTGVNPMDSVFRRRHGRTGTWSHDRGGSFNAVCAFLRELGVRWYMAGDLGEVVPERATIPLPKINRTVRPDFPIRYWFGAYFAYTVDDVLWERHLGMNSGYPVLGAGMHVHGMRRIQSTAALKATHPEYFALINGERDTKTRGSGHACFSSPGLVSETVQYARAVFDHYDEPAVSVWPQDGLRPCLCDACRGKSTSELVWGFVDRVARELNESHPDRLVTCGAYAQYQEPPDNIQKFSPNVAVFISNRGRPAFVHSERWDAYCAQIENWRRRLAPQRIIRNENNRYTLAGDRTGTRPVPFPMLHPHAFAKDLHMLKGTSLGEWNETPRAGKGVPGATFLTAPGLDHLNLYINSRFLWDGDQDIEVLLSEYFTLFYGPAAERMKAAFTFAEQVCATDQRPSPGAVTMEDRIRFVEMLHTARDLAGNTVYGQRIGLIIDELQPLDEMRRDASLAQQRGDVPVFNLALDMSNDKWDDVRDTFVLDGETDEPFWRCYYQGAGLHESRTGRTPALGATFMGRWHANALYIAVHCRDIPGQPLNITTTRDGDPEILQGDHVEILLETDAHAYYRLAVNPAGARLDMDMAERGNAATHWLSNAEAAAHMEEDGWSVELRIPVVSESEGAMDPLNYVVGGAPSSVWPWHFNVGRVRVRDNGVSVSAWSPTGSTNLQERIRFGKMYLR